MKNVNNNRYSGNVKNADFKGNIKYLGYKTLNAKDCNGQHCQDKDAHTPGFKFANSSCHNWTAFYLITYFFTCIEKIKREILVLEKPLQRDILIGSIRQCSADRDWKYSNFKFLEGDVNRIRKIF